MDFSKSKTRKMEPEFSLKRKFYDKSSSNEVEPSNEKAKGVKNNLPSVQEIKYRRLCRKLEKAYKILDNSAKLRPKVWISSHKLITTIQGYLCFS